MRSFCYGIKSLCTLALGMLFMGLAIHCGGGGGNDGGTIPPPVTTIASL